MGDLLSRGGGGTPLHDRIYTRRWIRPLVIARCVTLPNFKVGRTPRACLLPPNLSHHRTQADALLILQAPASYSYSNGPYDPLFPLNLLYIRNRVIDAVAPSSRDPRAVDLTVAALQAEHMMMNVPNVVRGR